MITVDFWHGKRVLVTGHTGFKGGWLCHWLDMLGAKVTGLGLDPATEHCMYTATGVEDFVEDRRVDVRNAAEVRRAVRESHAEIAFHLAAQPLVRVSYAEPAQTFDVNVMGTVNVLEAVRRTGSVGAVVVVTSDKCYENRETTRAYRETDAMGGYDPYSASKGCTELVASAYRRSYFHVNGSTQIASARAGNVIGGGDWAEDRIFPDCMRAFSSGRPVLLRRPAAIRPWQHALEPIGGYLQLAQALWEKPDSVAGSYNFGPDASCCRSVREVAGLAASFWGSGAACEAGTSSDLHEAGILTLDSTLAERDLGWVPRWTLETAVEQSVDWYRRFYAGEAMREATWNQIAAYARLVNASVVEENQLC
jgi:CDP-glucose 4,6-dehydratase